ncbi:MAG: GNAT family protein [Deinococcota bacterium]
MTQLLTLEDSDALVDFETRNKAWFEAWVPARPEAYFDKDQFPSVLAELIDGMSASSHLLFVRYQDNQIVGRFNLTNINAGQADVGYRVCQDYLGQGIASAGVAFLKRVAVNELNLTRLVARAATTNTANNIASQKVLLKQGFDKQPNAQERVEFGSKVIVLEQFAVNL